MARILLAALADLFDRRVRGALLKAALGAGVVLVGLWIGVGWALFETRFFASAWLEAVVDILGGVATVVVTLMLYPALASVATGFVLDEIAAAVEAGNGEVGRGEGGRAASALASLGLALRYLPIGLGVNLVLLLALVVPPVFPFVFWGANGYLLGREYFAMAAMRRVDSPTVAALRRANRGRIFFLGIAIAVAHSLPVVNLAAPAFATIVMVRAVEAWRRR